MVGTFLGNFSTDLAKRVGYFSLFTYHLVKFLTISYLAVKPRFLGRTFKDMVTTDSLAVFMFNYGHVN